MQTLAAQLFSSLSSYQTTTHKIHLASDSHTLTAHTLHSAGIYAASLWTPVDAAAASWTLGNCNVPRSRAVRLISLTSV